MRTCVVVAADEQQAAATAASIPRELYSVTTDRAAIPTADVLVIDDVWFTPLRPLAGIVDPAAVDDTILRHLRERGILEASDLGRLNLDQLAADAGRQALQRFVRELSRSGRYPDPERLQQFIIRRGIFV